MLARSTFISIKAIWILWICSYCYYAIMPYLSVLGYSGQLVSFCCLLVIDIICLRKLSKMSTSGTCSTVCLLFEVRRIPAGCVSIVMCLLLNIYNISGSSPDSDVNRLFLHILTGLVYGHQWHTAWRLRKSSVLDLVILHVNSG